MIRSSLIFFWCVLAAAPADRIFVGQVLPTVSGETLTGKELELPAADAGSSRILVFSFTKKASGDSKLWNEHMTRDFGSRGPAVFRVIFLESVPKVFRSMAISGIKSGLPEALWDRTLLVYQGEDAWKFRLVVTSDRHSYLVLLDGQGRVEWMSSRAFNEAEYADLKKLLGR